MAMYEQTRAAFGGETFGIRVSAIVNRVLAWNDARMTRNALSTLSDQELDDIGLVRGDIDTIRAR